MEELLKNCFGNCFLRNFHLFFGAHLEESLERVHGAVVGWGPRPQRKERKKQKKQFGGNKFKKKGGSTKKIDDRCQKKKKKR